VAAAAGLFAERGYDGASVTAIAAAADVAPETVYARVGTKRRLLAGLVARAVRGGDEPVLDQEGPLRIAASGDQREQLRLFVADIVPRIERVAPLFAVVRGAAATDPEIGALLDRMQETRLANIATFVDALLANGPLRCDRDTATRTVWALASPDMHRLLVREGGWSGARLREWLAGGLAAMLLPPPM